MSDRQTDTSHPSSTSYASSIIASIFGFAVLLPPEDRDAALALFDETAAARRA
jgi:hypothetical protein